jgi:hypothetical protein
LAESLRKGMMKYRDPGVAEDLAYDLCEKIHEIPPSFQGFEIDDAKISEAKPG